MLRNFLKLFILSLFLTLFSYKSYNYKPLGKKYHVEDYNVLNHVKTLCLKYDVPYEIPYNIGKNESGWINATDSTYIRRCLNTKEGSLGDLQMLPENYHKKYKHLLNLSDTPTRHSLLEASICYLSELHLKYNDWEKVRYAYARGSWKPKYAYKTYYDPAQLPLNVKVDTIVTDTFNEYRIYVKQWTKLESYFMSKFNWKSCN